MQPFTIELAKSRLSVPATAIVIGPTTYQFEIGDEAGWVRERSSDGERRYRIAHVMGGKNVFYFLTPLERGRLQVLPVAYDLREPAWFDTAASAVRHFSGLNDRPINWRDPLYTFNTSCQGCHVSQLSVNYDLATDSYRTTWAEPGINCETCHGPCVEHVRFCRETPAGRKPASLAIIRFGSFTPEQRNAACSSCHAKASALTQAFKPGDPFFDHFEVVALESLDFYPDGRDLGENYTLTSWLMNPCVKSGKLDCLHCHTSSGRYRFAGQSENGACLPCHEQRVNHAEAHTRHKPESPGNRCVACHMPTTEFARMRRSDHSMRPPAPSASLAFKSPNACNLCHTDRDAAWADREVRQWRPRDYQAAIVALGGLIESARRNDWSRLAEILGCLADPQRDEVFAVSFIRLLSGCGDPRKVPALMQALKDRSTLVEPLLNKALRIEPANAAANLNLGLLKAEQGHLRRAEECLRAALKAEPTLAQAAYNLAVILSRDRLAEAIDWCRQACRSQPGEPRYAYSLAFFLHKSGGFVEAERVLRELLMRNPDYFSAYGLLGDIYEGWNEFAKAAELYRQALNRPALPLSDRRVFEAKIGDLAKRETNSANR